jgi:hypothetical protein
MLVKQNAVLVRGRRLRNFSSFGQELICEVSTSRERGDTAWLVSPRLPEFAGLKDLVGKPCALPYTDELVSQICLGKLRRYDEERERCRANEKSLHGSLPAKR